MMITQDEKAAIAREFGSEQRALHDKYIERARTSGAKIASYDCPECSAKIEAIAPPKNDFWDSMSCCPGCNGLHFKSISTGADGAVSVSISRP